jgi:hypothetical protein
MYHSKNISSNWIVKSFNCCVSVSFVKIRLGKDKQILISVLDLSLVIGYPFCEILFFCTNKVITILRSCLNNYLRVFEKK